MTRIMFAAAILAAALLALAQSPPIDWESIRPHETPACDLPERAARAESPTRPCTCVRMVARIQTKRTNDCWAAHFGPIFPQDEEERIRIIRLTYPIPAQVAECLLTGVPDACHVVANGGGKYGYYSTDDQCGTRCKPERCACHDTACPAHEEMESY